MQYVLKDPSGAILFLFNNNSRAMQYFLKDWKSNAIVNKIGSIRAMCIKGH